MLKYTGIFGGVQGLASLITLLKVSIVSRLLGPIGVGMVDVYNRSIELLNLKENQTPKLVSFLFL